MGAVEPYKITKVTVERDQRAVENYTVRRTATVNVRFSRELHEVEKMEINATFLAHAGTHDDLDELSVVGNHLSFLARDDSRTANFLGQVVHVAENLAEKSNTAIAAAETELSDFEAALQVYVTG